MLGRLFTFRALLLLASSFLAGSVILDWLATLDLPVRRARAPDGAAMTPAGELGPGRPRSSIGKVSMLYGHSIDVYERALRSHDLHNEFHGYPMFVLRRQSLSEFWSKPAFLLDLLLTELSKPEDERLGWLV